MYPIGKARIVKISGEAVVVKVAARPPKGIEWLVLHGGAYSDDGAARTIHFNWYDEGLGLDFSTTEVAIGALSFVPIQQLMADATIMPSLNANSIKLTNDLYVEAEMNFLGAGKHLHMMLVVIERPENLDLALMEMFGNYMGYKLPIASRE